MPLVSMHQDHGQSPELCRGAIELGFSSVMLDGSLEADGEPIAGWDRRLPDEITILRFRHPPEKNRSTKQILAVTDATLILASTPTKNAGSEHAQRRMTKKGEALHFGMKARIGGDAGYQGARKRLVAEKGVTWRGVTRLVKRQVPDKTKTEDRNLDQTERSEASVHDKVDHPVRLIKRQVGDVQARDRGLKRLPSR